MAVQLREEIVKYLYVNTAKDLNYRLVVDGESLLKDSLTINFNAPLLKLIDTATTPNSGQLSIDTNGYTNLQASNHLYLRSGASKEIVFCTNTSARAKFNSSGHFLPGAADTYDMGTSSTRWKAIYANNIYAKNTASDSYRTVEVENSNGGVALQASNNRGLRDLTSQTWIIYTKASSGSTDTGIANLVHFEKGAISYDNITPSSNDTYTLGSSSYKWKNIYATQFNGDHHGTISDVTETNPGANTNYSILFIGTGGNAAVNATKYTVRTNQDFDFQVMNGTAETEGQAAIVLGNATATGTSGNKRGRLKLYGTNTGLATLQYTNSTASPSITIPEYGGYLTASASSQQNYTSEKAAYVPFYTQNYKQLGMNNGLRYYTLEGTADALGYGKLYLGNGTASGAAGNKYGLLKLYNINAISVDVRGNDIGSYGGLRTSGLKGSYHGILLGNTNGALTIMSKDGSDQGLYNEAISKWLFYHNGTGSICLLGSSVVADYPIVLNATTNIKGNMLADATGETNRSIRVKNDNGEVGIYTSTNRGLYDFTNTQWIIYVKKDIANRAYIPSGKGLTVENTTEAESATTGALVVSGGIGVAKNIYSGQKINAAQGLGVNATTGTGVGISLYGGASGTSAPAHGLMYAKTDSFGTHGKVDGDWATYFTMDETTTTKRGWIFRHKTNNVASISGTGDLSLNGNIVYTNSTYTDYPMIKFITGTNDGAGIIIGGGGLAIFGSGESASTVQSKGGSGGTALAGGTEYTYITSDGGIDFITNCQTWDSRKTISINTSGQIVRAGIGTSWWNGRDAALIRQNTSSGYAPILSMKTTNGSWELGHYNSNSWHNDLLFNYKDDTSYASGSSDNTVIHAARLTKDGYLTLANGLLVNGTARFAIGSSDAVTNKRFIIGTSGNRYLSFGGAGIQAYLADDTVGTLYLNNEGGLISTGSGGITTGGNIYPKTNNSKTVGTASYNWSAVHARALTSAGALGVTSASTMTMTSGGNFTLSTTGTNTITSTSTLYLKNTSEASIVFMVNGTDCGRWNPSGKFMIGSQGTQSTYELHVTGQSYFSSYLMTPGTYYADKQGADHGFYIRTNGTWTSRWYQSARGTVGDGTNAVTGAVYLMLGNAIASSTTTTEGAENARGILRIYGTNTGYTQIYPGTNNTSNYTLYLPGANGQFVYHTNDTAEGSSSLPVYITSGGKATAISKVTISSASGSAIAFTETRTGGSSVSFGVGEGNVNHGVYSNTLGKWMVYADGSEVHLNGNATTATSTKRWDVTATNPSTTSTDNSTGYFNQNGSHIYWYTQTGLVTDQPSQWGYILDIGTGSERHQIWMTQSGGNLYHRGGNGSGWAHTWRTILDSNNYTSYCMALSGDQTASGRKTFSGGITITRTTDAAAASDAKPALIVGGASTAQHIEIDGNEVMSKTNGTTGGELYLNSGCGTVHIGAGLNVTSGQISGRVSSGSWIHTTKNGALHLSSQPTSSSAAAVVSAKTSSGSWGICTLNGSNNLYFVWGSDTNYTNSTNTTAQAYIDNSGGVHGAVWNDYAEYRTTVHDVEPGRVVVENNDDTLSISTERLMPGANIVSDTFGFAIGETDEAKTPLAVSGRALAYPFEAREEYCAGDPVCSGPNGTVSKMTREEVMMYTGRMIGTVSAIPNYKTWGTGNIPVNGRIWIKVI